MFLLPERIRAFLLGLKKKAGRTYQLDQELNLALREAAQKQGRPEEEVLKDFALKGREQFSREGELEARWDSLTEREKEVLALACTGQPYLEIEYAESLEERGLDKVWSFIGVPAMPAPASMLKLNTRPLVECYSNPDDVRGAMLDLGRMQWLA